MKNGPIVVLGGYGQAGRALVTLLLDRTATSIVIAGRRLERAEELAHQLDPSSQRVRAARADASQPETLQVAFQGASLVIVTAMAARYAANIARACLDAGCDLFDLNEPTATLDTLQAMNSDIVRAGRLFVTQGGLSPGLQSAFVRLACSKLDRCRSVVIGNAFGFHTMQRPEQVLEVFDYVLDNRPRLFKDGRWQERPFGADTTKMDLGPCYGTRPVVLLDMAEMRGLPEQLGLEELAFYAAAPGIFTAIPITILLPAINRLRGGPIWTGLARATLWASKHLPHEACVYSIVVEASGTRAGEAQTVRIVLEHEDNHFSVAAVILAFLNQYEAGSFSQLSGVQLMGHIIDPERAIRDIETLGLHVTLSVGD